MMTEGTLCGGEGAAKMCFGSWGSALMLDQVLKKVSLVLVPEFPFLGPLLSSRC